MKTNNLLQKDDVRELVRDSYSKVALGQPEGCGCCGTDTNRPPATPATLLGYSPAEIAALPQGADLGLGCGNPQAIASLKPGETVLDLGSGAGFDCLLAAKRVGDTGRGIGVDMTPEMVSKARSNAGKESAVNVEFRLGEIQHLPLPDA